MAQLHESMNSPRTVNGFLSAANEGAASNEVARKNDAIVFIE
jgi:hypothetical protein